MSLDFDAAGLQTQHDEDDDYDQEDYERQQELHKLLTDLPDDMLEDSGDDVSQAHDGSVCGDHTIDDRTQHTWDPHTQWNELQGDTPTDENGESNYVQTPYHEDYTHEHGTEQFNGHMNQHHAWLQPQGQRQGYMYDHGEYVFSKRGTNPSAVEREFAQYPHAEPERDGQDHVDKASSRKQVQVLEGQASRDDHLAQYKVTFNPYQPDAQPKMFRLEGVGPDGGFDQLQREFLDSAHNSADKQQIAQLQILNKAQLRQIEDLEKKLEDCRRNMRYMEHQLAIVKDEKEGLAVSLKESAHLLQEAKEREHQLQGKVSALQLQVQTLTDKDCESGKKLQAAEAAVDSLKQQIAELCRSETLSRARQQHERDLVAIREQHEAKILVLQQKLDTQVQALEEQTELSRKLQEQLKQLERQREEERLERAAVINTLTKRLDESQQQCASLLHTGSVQEMNQLHMQLQQVQSAMKISENMNKSLQEELSELKEHVTLYESAIKLGVISLDSNGEWDNQLSDSYVELGIKKVNWKNSRFHSSPVTTSTSPDALPRTDMVFELKAELQRLLGSLKAKRQKISQLQEELQRTQARSQELQDQLDKAERSVRDSRLREISLEKQLEVSSMTAHQEELQQLRKDKELLQDRVEKLESQNRELKQSEEKVRAANGELCTKMREMIQELDQEKQEAAERYERTQQQFRDDVVNHVRTELAEEHSAQMEALQTECQKKVHLLELKLADLNKEMVAVQECYIAICREKDSLEESLQAKMMEERTKFEKELRDQMDKEREQALAQLKANLEAQHHVAAAATKAVWLKERGAEIQRQVEAQVALIQTTWEEDHSKVLQTALEEVERQWAQRCKQASTRRDGMVEERDTQTEGLDSRAELEALLTAQRLALQQEAAQVQARIVEEAVQHVEQDLHKKHMEALTQKVASAVSSARECWLQELTSLPEYKASLQAEREDWERRQEKETAQKMASVLIAAEEKWRREQEVVEAELRDAVRLLQQQLEQSKEEAAARLKAELAQARAAWNQDKQEEISRIQAQNEKDYRSFLDEQRCKLELALKQAKEEASRQKEAEFQQLFRDQQEEWNAQQESRSHAERKRHREEALLEAQSTLAEIQDFITNDPRWLTQSEEKPSSSPCATPSPGGLRAYLQTACRALLVQAVDQVKQHWKKCSEDQLARMLKEQEDQHKKELNRIRVSMLQSNELPCGQSCADSLQKLQKQCKDLKRHLEKACRQLQQTVHDHKAALQQLKEEHEDAMQKEREESRKKLEEVKRSSSNHPSLYRTDSSPDSQQSLQAGLEEMKKQYMKAVGKIRSDMLRYIQESKTRAAEMIRTEVLRERQETARKMRRYYLTCLQELLEDGGKAQGAEKKIINAASKLATMAKVLETPVSKKQGGRNRPVQTGSMRLETLAGEKAAKLSLSSSDQSTSPQQAATQTSTSAEKQQLSMVSIDRDSRPGAEHPGTKSPSETLTSRDSSMSDKRKVQQDAPSQAPPKPAQSLSLTPVGNGKSLLPVGGVTDEGQVHVTLRTQSRELYVREASDHLSTKSAVKPFLIKETPVKDGGWSNWNFVGSEPYLDHQNRTSAFPNGQSELRNASAFPVPSFISVSETDDDTDDDLSRYGSWSTYRKLPEVPNKAKVKPPPSASREGAQDTNVTKARDPIPGSEGAGLRRLCSKSLFPEMKACQQDSGFDSPLSLLPK
ncbi:centrosomal protein of 152 kDa [Scleropages formosus]|uniref:centrosomal protein of 152 kDa n=1 Tax=Scleropages formosus TaxID=113540 RepID=UPI0010FAC40C|nr:centrosomal protein of 152 kDa [Scleropages formosus]